MTKLITVWLYGVIVILFSCNSISTEMVEKEKDSSITVQGIQNNSGLIDKETALKIAEENALLAYRDISIYDISAELKEDKWFVDYTLSNPEMLGGGPHYVINAKTGEILSFRYEQ